MPSFLILIAAFSAFAILVLYANFCINRLPALLFSFFLYYVSNTLFIQSYTPVQLLGFDFAIVDYFGIFLIFVFFLKLYNGHYRGILKTSYGKILLVYLFSHATVIAFSFFTYGLASLKAYRYAFHDNTLLVVLAGYTYSEDKASSFIRYIRYLTVFVMCLFASRVLGLVPMAIGGYGYEFSIAKYRYLINTDVLVLLLFYIQVSLFAQAGRPKRRFEGVLQVGAILLILISIQRAIIAVFMFYLVYEMWATRGHATIQKGIFVGLTGLFTLSLFGGLIPSDFFEKVLLGFSEVIYDFDKSTASMKSYDIPATLFGVIQRGTWMFGELIRPEQMFERAFRSFFADERLPVHNMFLLTFVRGGLFLAIPYMLLWLYHLRLNWAKGRLVSPLATYHKIGFFWLLSLFAFNNTSGVGFLNTYCFGFSMLLLSETRNSGCKRSPSRITLRAPDYPYP